MNLQLDIAPSCGKKDDKSVCSNRPSKLCKEHANLRAGDALLITNKPMAPPEVPRRPTCSAML